MIYVVYETTERKLNSILLYTHPKILKRDDEELYNLIENRVREINPSDEINRLVGIRRLS